MVFPNWFLKMLLHIVNLLYMVASILLILGGGYLLSGFEKYKFLVPVGRYSAALVLPSTLMTLGSLILVASIIGSLGIFLQHDIILLVYSAVQTLFLLLEAAILCTTILYSEILTGIATTELELSLSNYTNNMATKIVWDELQTSLACCGIKSWNDYAGLSVVDSCCRQWEQGCSNVTLDDGQTLSDFIIKHPDWIYTDGCMSKLANNENLKYSHYGLILSGNCTFFGCLVALTLGMRYYRLKNDL